MKKPLIKDYCKPFILDPNNRDLVSFNSKGYAKAAKVYIERIEKERDTLFELLTRIDGSNPDYSKLNPTTRNQIKEVLKK